MAAFDRIKLLCLKKKNTYFALCQGLVRYYLQQYFEVKQIEAIFRRCLFRSSHRTCSLKKGVLKKFAKFTEKHQCWSFFLIKLQA